MGHLQDVGPQVGPGVEQVVLGGQFGVAGQQDRRGRGGGAQQQRDVVHRRPVAAVDRQGRVDRAEDLQAQLRPPQLHPAHEPHHRSPGPLGVPGDLAQPRRRFPHRPDGDPARGPTAQCAGEAAVVVGVEVGDHHELQDPDPEPVQAGVDGVVGRPGVDQDGVPRGAGGEDERVALTHVAGHHPPPGGRPAGRGEPGRDEDDEEPDQQRQQQRPQARHPAHRQQNDEHPGEQQRAARARGPRHGGTGHRGGPVPDHDQPPHERPRQPGAAPRCGRAHRGQHRTEHAQHRRGGDRGRREQVRHHGDQPDSPVEPGDHRCGGQRRGDRDDQRLGRPGRQPTPSQRRRPPRSEQHQRTGGDDGQHETRVDGQSGDGQQQAEHGHRQRGHRGPGPAGGERDEHDPAHHRRPQHRRRRPGQHDEPDQGDHRHRGRDPRVGPEQAQQEQHRPGHDRDVGAGDGREVREPGGPEVLLGLGELGAGVPDREPGQQPCRRLGQCGVRRVAQAVAQGPGPGLPPRRRGHVLRCAADLQHGDGEVGTLCGHEQPGGGDLLAGEQPGPLRCRGQEQELPAGGRATAADGGRDELGGDQRHRPGGAGLVATTGRAAQDPGVVGEPDADLGGGAAVGGPVQRV